MEFHGSTFSAVYKILSLILISDDSWMPQTYGYNKFSFLNNASHRPGKAASNLSLFVGGKLGNQYYDTISQNVNI